MAEQCVVCAASIELHYRPRQQLNRPPSQQQRHKMMPPLKIAFGCFLALLIILLLIAFCAKMCHKDTLNITQEGWTWITNFPVRNKPMRRENSRSNIIHCDNAKTDQTEQMSVYCIKDTCRLQVDPPKLEPDARSMSDSEKFCDMEVNANMLQEKLDDSLEKCH